MSAHDGLELKLYEMYDAFHSPHCDSWRHRHETCPVLVFSYKAACHFRPVEAYKRDQGQ